MILPIVAYGHKNLRAKSIDISPDYPQLSELIENMWETMYETSGVGLAAPQINKSIRLFIVDATYYQDEKPEAVDFKKVFINAEILERFGEDVAFTEGCLSVPDIHEEVIRKEKIRIRYLDENFEPHEEILEGIVARIVQHEYDHLEGVLFVDKIHPLRKIMNKKKLSDIQKGITEANYKMIFANKKK